MNPADQWLAINAKYFPAEQIQYIRQRIEALPEAQVQLLYTLSFQDPTMMLVISLFGGSLGIDRFILGHVGLGVGKLLTCGGCGIWTIVDWFLIMNATKAANLEAINTALATMTAAPATAKVVEEKVEVSEEPTETTED